MKYYKLLFSAAVFCALIQLGCDVILKEEQKEKAKPAASEQQQTKKVFLGKNVLLEVLPNKKRRVLVQASVCMREGQLEQLLCRTMTKEHEAILAADVDARHIHAALLAAGAEDGSPVKFVPKYTPAHGTTVRVLLRYKNKKGKLVTVPAQKWVRHMVTKKDLKYEWVFAGSQFIRNPNNPDQTPHYAANEGDVICVSNFETAMLDLPVKLPNENAELLYEAHTERIPALKTPVTVILEPVVKSGTK